MSEFSHLSYNFIFQYGNTALHEAAWNGYSKSVDLLLKNKSNPFIGNRVSKRFSRLIPNVIVRSDTQSTAKNEQTAKNCVLKRFPYRNPTTRYEMNDCSRCCYCRTATHIYFLVIYCSSCRLYHSFPW